MPKSCVLGLIYCFSSAEFVRKLFENNSLHVIATSENCRKSVVFNSWLVFPTDHSFWFHFHKQSRTSFSRVDCLGRVHAIDYKEAGSTSDCSRSRTEGSRAGRSNLRDAIVLDHRTSLLLYLHRLL